MGEVWKARDTRLARDVALKILRLDVADEPARRRRFETEARAVAALNHPNIVSIYDVGNEGSLLWIVSELVEGKPLCAGELPLRKKLDLAIQIAAGLAAAHSSGIVHRDLKPDNVLVTREGRVKILDFGLAKLFDGLGGAAHNDITQTLPGTVMGTVGYMSPEQVRGEDLDHRSDIFSFGTVLHELLSGGRAFQRDTAAETMTAILKKDPPELPVAIPAAIQQIVRRCLEKAPGNRFQSGSDLAFALRSASDMPVTASGQALAQRGFRHNTVIRYAAAFLLGVLLCAAALRWFGTGRSATAALNRIAFIQLTDDAGPELFPSLSPDGKYLVYSSGASGNWDIHLQRIEDREQSNLTQGSGADNTRAAFSPDGKSIAFRSERGGGGIFIMNRDGGEVRRVAPFGYDPAWSPDGRQLLCAEEGVTRPEARLNFLSRLWVIDIASGKQWTLGENDVMQPRWSPHGQRIAYWASDKGGHRDIWTTPAKGGQAVPVTHDEFVDWSPVWSPDGNKLYFSSNRGGSMNLWRVGINESTGRVLGPPEPVATPSEYSGLLSFSADGRRLAYVRHSFSATLNGVLFDSANGSVLSEPKPITSPEGRAERISLSPDNQWLAFNSSGAREAIFVVRTDGMHLKQLTDGRNGDRGPRWSPDGKRLALYSNASGNREIAAVDKDGSTMQQLTFLAGLNVTWPVWAPSGHEMAYTVFGGGGSFVMDLRRDWKSQKLKSLQYPSESGEIFSAWNWSPDGKRIAGFIQRKDGTYSGLALYDVASGAFEKITDYGADPVWLSDNRRLLFLHNGKIHLVDSTSRQSRQIFSIAPQEVARRGFDISKDDRHIYFSVIKTEANVWLALLE